MRMTHGVDGSVRGTGKNVVRWVGDAQGHAASGGAAVSGVRGGARGSSGAQRGLRQMGPEGRHRVQRSLKRVGTGGRRRARVVVGSRRSTRTWQNVRFGPQRTRAPLQAQG